MSIADAITRNDAIGQEHTAGGAGGMIAIAKSLDVDWFDLHSTIAEQPFVQAYGDVAGASLEAGFLYGVRWARENHGD